MRLKEILVHRLRDFDSIFRAKNKIGLTLFILLRQFCKVVRWDEENINFLIRRNTLHFDDYLFLTREKTLDFLFFSKYYEPETTKFLRGEKGKTLIDVGAHLGRFAILASNNFDEIVALEPLGKTYNHLKKNIQLNNLSKKIVPLNLAASSEKGEAVMSPQKMNTGASRIDSHGKIKIKKDKLDNIIKKNKINFKEVDLILVDAEGHEIKVLQGAQYLLKNSAPTIIIETFKLKEVSEFLGKFGFKKVKTLDFYNHVFSKIKKV